MTDCAHRFEKLHFKFDGTPILFCPECGQEEADCLTAPVVLANTTHSPIRWAATPGEQPWHYLGGTASRYIRRIAMDGDVHAPVLRNADTFRSQRRKKRQCPQAEESRTQPFRR
jgi:hypothetical protein